jgi:hypothetical protein
MMREYQVRICERLGVQFPGPTRRFPTWTKFWVVAAAVLLSPVLAFLMAIAVEISIGAVEEAGALPLLALVVAGAIGCSLIRKAGARP